MSFEFRHPTPDEAQVDSEFAALAARDDIELDVIDGAMLIAREHYPTLDGTACRQRLAALANTLKERLQQASTLREHAKALVDLIHKEEGFFGDEHDYYNPENSFINIVLEKKKGIPLTLGLVYLCVGRGAGLRLEGLNTPSHFLVKLCGEGAPSKNAAGGQEVIIDPFSGKLLSDEGFRERLRRTLQLADIPQLELVDYFRKAATSRDILCRMLSNLKYIYLGVNDNVRALKASDRILQLVPGNCEELIERGLLYEKLGCSAAAIKDYERLLTLAPKHPAATSLRLKLPRLRRKPTTFH